MTSQKKFIDLDGLSHYDSKIKEIIIDNEAVTAAAISYLEVTKVNIKDAISNSSINAIFDDL